MFSRRLAADPDTPFLFLPDGRSWTFRQIDELVQSLRARLVAHGVRPGEIVGLYQWNEPSWFATVLAVWSLGAVAALCGAVSPEAEAVRRFELVRPKAVVSSEASDFGGAWPCINVDLAGQVVRESPAGAASPDPGGPGPGAPGGPQLHLLHVRDHRGGQGAGEDPCSSIRCPQADGRHVLEVTPVSAPDGRARQAADALVQSVRADRQLRAGSVPALHRAAGDHDPQVRGERNKAAGR